MIITLVLYLQCVALPINKNGPSDSAFLRGSYRYRRHSHGLTCKAQHKRQLLSLGSPPITCHQGRTHCPHLCMQGTYNSSKSTLSTLGISLIYVFFLIRLTT